MQTVIYADILFFMNSVITFLILLTTADIIRINSKKIRYFSGALTGGVLSFIILAPSMNYGLILIVRLLCSLLIVLITFRIKNIRQFLKCVAGFFLISFLYAGIVIFISEHISFIEIYYNNGFTYYDFSALSLIISSSLIFISVKFLNRKIFGKSPSDLLFDIDIYYNGCKVSVCALYDTGNSIKDIYSGKPVIIVSLNMLEELFEPDNFNKLTKMFEDGIMSELPDAMRLLPIKTIGEKKLLPAFTAQSVTVCNGEICRTLHKACIAITDDSFGDNNYKALINEKVLGKAL